MENAEPPGPAFSFQRLSCARQGPARISSRRRLSLRFPAGAATHAAAPRRPTTPMPASISPTVPDAGTGWADEQKEVPKQ